MNRRLRFIELQDFEPRGLCHIVGTAAAIIGGAIIGAAGSAIAGSSAASATKSAANTAAAAQDRALAQQAELSKPYRDLGTNNIQTYQDLLTGGDKGAAGMQSTLESLPGYQFTRDQGVEGAKRAAAASGMNLSGNQLTAVETYGSDLANQTYSQRLQELLQPINLGQAAAAGQAANVGGAAANLSNIATAQGNNIASINANTVAGITKAIGNAGNQYITQQTLAGLNNPGTYTYGGSPSSGLISGPDLQPTYGAVA